VSPNSGLSKWYFEGLRPYIEATTPKGQQEGGMDMDIMTYAMHTFKNKEFEQAKRFWTQCHYTEFISNRYHFFWTRDGVGLAQIVHSGTGWNPGGD
jgi:hypothetical protein